MKLKQIISAVMITALLPLGTGPAAFGAESSAEVIPQLTITEAKVSKNGGLVIIDDGTNDDVLLETATPKLRSTVSTSYNSTPDSLQYITEPKNQGGLGTCWAFSSSSCIETLLMKQDNSSDTGNSKYDLSELHAVLACGKRFLQDGTYGLVALDYDDGGNQEMYAMYATRAADTNFFNGPVEDKYMPYTEDETEVEAISDADMAISTAGGYFPGSYSELTFSADLDTDEINSRNTIIKNLVNAYGSVSISIGCGEAQENNYENFKDTDKYSLFYEPENNGVDHAVTIVGYDDSFDGDYFETAGFENPGMDGAFLVKNSWGTDWGLNSGYFYMSYASFIGYIYAYGNLISRDSYDYEYDYTPFGATGGIPGYQYDGVEDSPDFGVFANDFTKQSGKKEQVNKVSVYVYSPDTDLQIYIDADGLDGTESDMQLVSVKDPTDSIAYTLSDSNTYINVPYSGNYVFELAEPIEVDDNFTVAVYAESYNGAPVACEGMMCYETGETYLNHKFINKSYFTYDVNAEFSKLSDTYGEYDLMIRAYTEEVVDVTVDETVYKADCGTVLSDFLSDNNITETIYEAVSGETNSYQPADTAMELTDDLTLYTGSYIYAPAITMNNYQTDDEGSIRFVGEIKDDFNDAVEKVTALGFVYSADGGVTEIKEECGKELYTSLTNYPEQSGVYLFKSDELTTADYIVKAYVSYVISGKTDAVTVYTEEKTVNTSSDS